MDNNDILDLTRISSNKKTNTKNKKRKRGDGSKTREGNARAIEQRQNKNNIVAQQKKQNRFNYNKQQAKKAGLSYSDYSRINNQLEGVTDNAERLRITDNYLNNKEKNRSGAKERSLKGSATSFNYLKDGHPVKAPYSNSDRPSTTFADRFKKGIAPIQGALSNILEGVGRDLPNSVADMMTATNMGLPVKQTTLGKVGSLFGASEITGYNPISGENINIDYLSDKIGRQGFDIKESDNFLTRSFKKISNKYLDGKGADDLEIWKQAHIEETAKSVRRLGDNVNPFDSGENLEYLSNKRELKLNEERLAIAERRKEVVGPSSAAYYQNNIMNFQKKMEGQVSNNDLHAIKHRDSIQLAEVEKRISDAQNNVKNFFNPVDKAELNMLQSTQRELTERIRRIDGNYGAANINTSAIDLPKSVADSFTDLNNRRNQILTQLESHNSNSIYDNASSSMLKKELNQINGSLSQHTEKYSGVSIPNSSILSTNAYGKTYMPSFGTSGYGLGMKNAMAASSAEHFTRALHFANPFGVGGASAMQAVGESFGYMGKVRRMQAAQARGLGKIPHAMVPALGAGQLFLGMSNKEDVGKIYEDIFATGTSLAGWRLGSAIGGGIGGLGNVATKGIGLLAGGVAGLAAGFVVGTAVAGGISDITSNESQIRSFAKKIATKESSVQQVDTRQSLTARMASLNKLARSGLNDRGLLLGNEAMILQNGG